MSQSTKLLTEISKASHAVDKVFRQMEDEAAQKAAERAKEIQTLKQAVEKKRADAKRTIAAERKKLEDEKKHFEEEKARMAKILAVQKEKVTLDVGGNRFSTAMATLRSIEGSRFDDFFNGELEPDEDDGSYFIDRDGRHFHLLLEFLRNPETFEMPTDPGTRTELEKEAAYYRVELPKSQPRVSAAPAQSAPSATQPETSTAQGQGQPRKPTLSVANEATSHPEAYENSASPDRKSRDGRYYRESWYGDSGTPPVGAAGNTAAAPPMQPVAEQRDTLNADVFTPTPSVDRFGGGPPPMTQPLQPATAPPPVSQPAAALFNGGAPYGQQQPGPPQPTTAPPPAVQQGGMAPPPLASAGGGYGSQQPYGGAPPAAPYQPGSTPMAPPPLMQGPPTTSMYTPPQQPAAPAQPQRPPSSGYSSSQWGSAQLDGMNLGPMSQPERNQLRGWNDPPKLNSSRTRPVVSAPPPVAGFAPQMGAPTGPGSVPAPYQPVTPTPAPIQAPAPAPAAPPPKRNFVLPEHAQEMAKVLRSTLDRCRRGPAAKQTKVKQVEAKLDSFYEGVADGAIDATIVEQVHRIATSLEGGQHQHALEMFRQLTQVHGMDDVGQKLMPIKGLCGLVKGFVEKNQW